MLWRPGKDNRLHVPVLKANAMNRLAQAGILCTALGGILFFLGIFPSAADVDKAPGVGIAQISLMLSGLSLVVVGGYVIAYAILQAGRPRSLWRDIGVRLGMTGLVFMASTAFADTLGFGSHPAREPVFGWVQTLGTLTGFVTAMLGVLIYGLARL